MILVNPPTRVIVWRSPWRWAAFFCQFSFFDRVHSSIVHVTLVWYYMTLWHYDTMTLWHYEFVVYGHCLLDWVQTANHFDMSIRQNGKSFCNHYDQSIASTGSPRWSNGDLAIERLSSSSSNSHWSGELVVVHAIIQCGQTLVIVVQMIRQRLSGWLILHCGVHYLTMSRTAWPASCIKSVAVLINQKFLPGIENSILKIKILILQIEFQ